MLEQDYLMRQFLALFQALARAAEKNDAQDNPLGAAETLEDAVSNATEMDGVALLSLAPESIAQVIRVTGIDPDITQFIARSLLLESVYLKQAHQEALADLRFKQAHAIALAYDFELPDDPSDFESITEGLEDLALACGYEM